MFPCVPHFLHEWKMSSRLTMQWGNEKSVSQLLKPYVSVQWLFLELKKKKKRLTWPLSNYSVSYTRNYLQDLGSKKAAAQLAQCVSGHVGHGKPHLWELRPPRSAPPTGIAMETGRGSNGILPHRKCQRAGVIVFRWKVWTWVLCSSLFAGFSEIDSKHTTFCLHAVVVVVYFFY